MSGNKPHLWPLISNVPNASNAHVKCQIAQGPPEELKSSSVDTEVLKELFFF